MHSRLIRLSVTAAVTAIAAVGAMAPASASGAGVMRAAKVRGGVHASGSGGNLAWNGGPVETAPVIYVDFWGSQWTSGTTTAAKNYITGFFSSVGGSAWANIDSQYCGSNGCVTNPAGQLAQAVVHQATLPRRISQSSIAAEALWLMNATGGYKANATYFVYTPSGHSMSGFATSWCAWHSSVTSGSNTVAYAYMPYQPDAGYNCGANSVDGSFDGFSIVGGHEYAEAVTDPHPSSGWTDNSGSEIGDKCAWIGLSNQKFGTTQYPVQPLWSNAVSGCATSYP